MRFLVGIWKPPTVIDYGLVDLENISMPTHQEIFVWDPPRAGGLNAS